MLVSRHFRPSLCESVKERQIAAYSKRSFAFGKRRPRLDEVLTAPERSKLPLPSTRNQEVLESSVPRAEARTAPIVRVINSVDGTEDKKPRESLQHMTKDAMRRLAMKHVPEPHSCAHCEKVNIDFFEEKTSKWKSASDSAWVRCAKSIEDVVAAQRDGCHFFSLPFRVSRIHEVQFRQLAARGLVPPGRIFQSF